MDGDDKISINQRVKKIRKALKFSQREFSILLSLSHSYIAGVETEYREVNDRLVKLIASEYGVNEEWLRTGHGEMFAQNPDEKFTKLVSLFKELPPKYQEVVLKLVEALLQAKDAE